MAKMNLLIFISVTVLISGSLSADSENERGTENRLREILGLHERRNAPLSRNNNARKERKLLSPTKALRNLIPEEEQSFMAKRLAYTDPYYNRYLEDNQISGTCEHEGLVFQGGMVIHTSGCKKECYCPLGGGQASCVRLQCDILRCVDAIHEPDMCCAVCHSGENCLADNLGEKQIIPAGVDVILPHGRCRKKCMCPAEKDYAENGRLTEAYCVQLC